MISAEHRRHLMDELAQKLLNSVRLAVFTQKFECPYCAQTRNLMEELAGLSDKISVEVYDFVADADKARAYGIDKVPAVAVIGAKDYGLRFYGLPYGYEFGTLLEGMISVSRGKADLSEETRARLKDVKVPVHIQVFVTLTCPYCPSVASLAFKFAVESDMIKADVIDVSEFPPYWTQAWSYGRSKNHNKRESRVFRRCSRGHFPRACFAGCPPHRIRALAA